MGARNKVDEVLSDADLSKELATEAHAAFVSFPDHSPGDGLDETRNALRALRRLLPDESSWLGATAAQRAAVESEVHAALAALPAHSPGDEELMGSRDALQAMRRLLAQPRQQPTTRRGSSKALLRNRGELQEALDALPRGSEWTLDNCRWDYERSNPRYQASHLVCGVLGAASGPELLAAIEAVESRREELKGSGLLLWRGNTISPGSAWWVSDKIGNRGEGALWATDLFDLFVLVAARLRRASSAARTPAPAKAAQTFAQQVLTVARAVPADGWFGREKVFLSRVYARMAQDYPDRKEWNAALLEANRTHQLILTRADLVSAMNPTDVAESEVKNHGASYHFVVARVAR